jgi:hypothetical protein
MTKLFAISLASLTVLKLGFVYLSSLRKAQPITDCLRVKAIAKLLLPIHLSWAHGMAYALNVGKLFHTLTSTSIVISL